MYTDDFLVERKRQASPQLLTTSSLGTKKENPIEVDSEKSVTEFIDVGGEAITGSGSRKAVSPCGAYNND